MSTKWQMVPAQPGPPIEGDEDRLGRIMVRCSRGIAVWRNGGTRWSRELDAEVYEKSRLIVIEAGGEEHLVSEGGRMGKKVFSKCVGRVAEILRLPEGRLLEYMTKAARMRCTVIYEG